MLFEIGIEKHEISLEKYRMQINEHTMALDVSVSFFGNTRSVCLTGLL